MAWRKSPASLVALFEAVLPDDPRLERRQMFGYPCTFLHGNMCVGLHQEDLVLRLDEAGRAALLAVPGAAPFEPMPGRPMKGYFVAGPRLLENPEALRSFVLRSVAHVASLPQKPAKAARAAKAAKADAGPSRSAVRSSRAGVAESPKKGSASNDRASPPATRSTAATGKATSRAATRGTTARPTAPARPARPPAKKATAAKQSPPRRPRSPTDRPPRGGAAK